MNQKFINNLNLLRKLLPIFKLLKNIEYTEEQFIESLKSDITLEELFKINNLNTNINYFILSIPKTGNIYIHNVIKSITDDVCQYHSIIEYLYIDIRFINFTIKNIIEFIASKTSYTFLYIIVSYREPISRYISRYLWDVKLNIEEINKLEKINIINEETFYIIENDDYDIMYNNILNDFNIDLNNYTYDKLNGYKIINFNDKINFVFTRIEDIDKMFLNFFNINIENNVFCKNENNLNSKKILFTESIKNNIYEK